MLSTKDLSYYCKSLVSAERASVLSFKVYSFVLVLIDEPLI